MEDHQKKGLAKWAMRKSLKRRMDAERGISSRMGRIPPHPVFFVSVASKGLSQAVSLLFATLTGRSIRVADKKLKGGESCGSKVES
jgi:hypothetical protein